MTSEGFEITRMPPGMSNALSTLIAGVIEQLPYYNERARSEEMAKYSSHQLDQQAAEDPDAVIVAIREGAPIGFCLSRYDDGLIWLSWFGVATGERRSGIGRALVRALLDTVRRRGAHKLWCDTRTENAASDRLLNELGFTRLVRMNNHWYGQDFYLWERYPD